MLLSILCFQMLQSPAGGHQIIQTSNGQQILVQTLGQQPQQNGQQQPQQPQQQQTIQVANGPDGSLQQFQVLPVQVLKIIHV